MTRVALLLVGLAGLVAMSACGSPDRATVRIDGDPWTVLEAGPDGMRGRTDFDGADGMLFRFKGPKDPGAIVFVMDGVTIPLDIAWFAADGTLVGTAAMVPCPADPCPSYAAAAPFQWAIEAHPGAFDDLAPDARLELP